MLLPSSPRVQIHGKGHSSDPEDFEGRKNSFQGTKPNNDPCKPAKVQVSIEMIVCMP